MPAPIGPRSPCSSGEPGMGSQDPYEIPLEVSLPHANIEQLGNPTHQPVRGAYGLGAGSDLWVTIFATSLRS